MNFKITYMNGLEMTEKEMEKVLPEVIQAYARMKWDYIHKNNGQMNISDFIKDYPVFKKFKGSCIYCQIFVSNCDSCPLARKDKKCKIPNSAYNKWLNNPNMKTATKMKEIIESITIKEIEDGLQILQK